MQEKIEPERRGRYRVAYPHRERAAHKAQYGARHYGHDGGPYTGHCGHDRRLAVKFRVKISDEGEHDHRRYDHAEYRGERARVAGITITVQKGHVSDEQPRQAARDAGQVEQFDVRYFLLLVDVQPLHLGYDVQSAAERKAAEFQELYEEPESASGLFHCASPHARKGKAYTWCKVKRFFRPAAK